VRQERSHGEIDASVLLLAAKFGITQFDEVRANNPLQVRAVHLEAVDDDATPLFGPDALVLLLVRGVEPQIQELDQICVVGELVRIFLGWFVSEHIDLLTHQISHLVENGRRVARGLLDS